MDHRLFFVLGDLVANLVMGLVAGWLSWAIVDTQWNMIAAMVVMMLVGMVAGLFLFFLVTIKLGAMEAMVSLMFTGMLAGMIVGMAAAMMPLSLGECLALGLLSGLAGIAIIWIANSLLRGVSKRELRR